MNSFSRILVSYYFLTFVLLSCGDNANKNSTNDGNLNSTNHQTDTCNCSLLNIDSLGTHLLDSSLYTGNCVSYYEGTTNKYIEKNLLKGKLHGKVIYYDKAGELLFEEIFENGKQKRNGALDQTLTCDCNELELLKTNDPIISTIAKLDDIPFTGKCKKFYKDSEQLYMESDYKNGFLEGRIIYYNRDGSTILIEKYFSGQLIGTMN